MASNPISLTIDLAGCTACMACELACSLVKEGSFSPSLSRIQIVQVYDLGVNVPLVCTNCVPAACVDVCPSEAIERDERTGVVRLLEDRCSFCADCVAACPYGAIHLPRGREVPLLCDLCGGDPACVPSCLYGALRFENQPDHVFSALALETTDEPLPAKRWTVASLAAEQVRRSWEAEK